MGNNYKVYGIDRNGRQFIESFTSTDEHRYTLPEIEKILNLKDLAVDPSTVGNEYMTAYGYCR